LFFTTYIQRHCAEIRQADGLVIVHPNWWGEPPAMLKGWVDRVLRAGVAYDFPPGPQGARFSKKDVPRCCHQHAAGSGILAAGCA